jgi:tetratricopeptide (TPR) repeat protein
MVFGREFSEKLTHLMVATAICCATASATVIPVPTAIGLVEALLGGAALAHFVLHRRYAKADALVRRCARQMESGSDAWLEAEFRGDRDAGIKPDVAIAAIREVVPLIVPKPEELVGARLSEDRVAAFYLDRAAKMRPGAFGDNTDNPIARQLFRAVVANAYRLIVRQPEFAAEVLHHSLAELLTGQDEIRQGQEAGEMRADARHAEVMATVAALAAQVSVEKGVPLPVLREILSRLGEAEAPLDATQIEQRLRAKAEDYHQLRERLGRLTNDDPGVQELRRKAAGQIDEGRFDEADASLAKAEAVDLAAVEELESIALCRRASAAASRAERAAAARLRLNYRAAAAHFAEAATIVANDDGATWNYRLSHAGVLYDQGSEFGDNAALAEAISVYRDALRLVPSDRVPLDWAMTQNNLGTALQTLGERESGTARLEEAVTAYRAALTECTRDRMPLRWAMTQNNLGTALSTLGALESGTARLEEAVAAHGAALAEYTRDRVPLQWAMTQNNLGTALSTLGERESGTARLEEAVAAYRATLAERTRDRVPLDWAMTQNNLGIALTRLGVRESGTARLEEAVAAYRAALAERTRDRVPLDWAMSTGNQGVALMVLAERIGDPSKALAAVEQIEVALATMREGGHAPFAAYYEARLPLARALLDRLAGG